MIEQTAEALTYFGNRAVEQGNEALARWLYEEGLDIWRALDFQPGIAHLRERLDGLGHGRAERRLEDGTQGAR